MPPGCGGETAVAEDDVSILQSVTPRRYRKTSGRSSSKIREGVMIGAGAKISRQYRGGRGAKIGAGSRRFTARPAAHHRRRRSGAYVGKAGQR